MNKQLMTTSLCGLSRLFHVSTFITRFEKEESKRNKIIYHPENKIENKVIKKDKKKKTSTEYEFDKYCNELEKTQDKDNLEENYRKMNSVQD